MKGKTMPVTLRRWVIFYIRMSSGCLSGLGGCSANAGRGSRQSDCVDTGHWGFRFLLITLAVSPVVRHLKWRWLMVHRRMLGLFAMFYGILHLLAYYQFILGGNLALLGKELVNRPYILVGAPALLILLALGVTSTRGWMKRLGKRWQSLHRLVYLAVLLVWIHLFWQVRSSYFDAVVYGLIGALLFSDASAALVVFHPVICPTA
ncbi:sulfoxide reductase heme-binding subunit YedZ [Vibrio sp. PP-XX7]